MRDETVTEVSKTLIVDSSGGYGVNAVEGMAKYLFSLRHSVHYLEYVFKVC